jgi:hypothetical protein
MKGHWSGPSSMLGGDHILQAKPQGFALLVPIGLRIFGERDSTVPPEERAAMGGTMRRQLMGKKVPLVR